MSESVSLHELQAIIRKFCDERDWDQFHNPKDLSISLALEAAEVMEHFQWKSPAEMVEHVTSHKSEVGEELVDVLFQVLLMANKLDIDLADAFQVKMKKNAAKYPVEKARGSHKKYTELTS
jgi:NTP pyrophosphatase (non-canonical NTP hydrolase)